VSHEATHSRLSPYIKNIELGFFARLNFPAHLEQDFRKHYSQNGVTRARVMPCFAIMMTVIGAVLRVAGDAPWLFMTIWDVGFFLPLLLATLYASTQPDLYRWYQGLLALSGLVSGLVVSSLYFRPSLLDMPSYFSMEVTWLLGVWLILGLRFVPAAIVTFIITSAHVAGIVLLGYDIKILGYEVVMLLLVNCIGAICCYQLEYTSRRSFIEALEVEELTRELSALAETDALTGLNNRRTYDAYLDRLWRQCDREQSVLTIIMIDIDYFKLYNDHYGHQSGDAALVAVADVIGSYAKRPLDFAARYGGEEFVLALHGDPIQHRVISPVESGRAYTEKLREAIRALQMPHELSTTDGYLTVSIGVAIILPGSDRSLAGAVQMADEALYQAKAEGRNRVVVEQTGDSQFNTGRFRPVNNSVA
jgi:diguanylate cyclase (GGDEF)-like protein